MNYLKYSFIFLASCFFTTDSVGQFGVKLGIHSFDLSSPRQLILDETTTISYRNAELGFQGGLFAKVDLGSVFLETRAMLHSTKVSYTLDGDNEGLLDNIRDESFTNLDIPMLIGFDFLIMNVFVGPVAHLHLNSTSDIIDFDGYEARFDTANYGYRAGIGFGLGKASVSVEYEGNFSKFGDHINIAGQNFSFDDIPSRILVNVGFNIF